MDNQKESEDKKVEALQARTAELERALRQKQMVLDFHDKMIEIASEELNVDLKKKYKSLDPEQS